MRVVILTDAGFARREQALLSRLEIGLADEGVRVIHAVPASATDPAPSAAADLFPPGGQEAGAEQGGVGGAPRATEQAVAGAGGGLYCTSVTYQDVGFAFSVGSRARRLVRAIAAALDEPEDLTLDLIHVFGQQVWGLGAELARMTGARLVLEVWSAVLLPATARAPGAGGAKRGSEVTGALGGAAGSALAGPPAFIVPGRALAQAVSRHAPLAGVHVAPWGVPVVESARASPGEGEQSAIAATVFATGTDMQAVLAALEGLRDVGAAESGGEGQLLVFLDSQAAGRPQIWRRVRKLGLMERLSVVADVESRREPILHTSALVQPEAMGEHRSLTLAAMAAGMSVVARADPMIDSLIDGRTARLVNSPTPGAWAEALRQVLSDRAYAERLAASARQYVHDHHSVSAYVSAVLTAYETLLTPPARVTA